LVDEALATAGYRCEEADWYRIKGDLLLRQYGENAAGAEKCFRNAIELACMIICTVVVALMTTGSRPAPFRIPVNQGKNGLILLDRCALSTSDA
jgi:hypothetical protein